ncbi:hypothetical protein CL6EHI_130460 [Entamoeba histolytica]|uniref:Uncharacterized protein n=2 Tax=Entamoeba histolytica TaxID=5759 RepID=C4MAQ3_ENTH1|nr:hypothetical protein EHI_130460 [Entamoeba histolytica HM-1:IMSS]EAL43042.1 hypothetical protein EHI_130460 [Entamoeba histolytica HM-1:IMSS]GAT98910.1 hypothetical protein CL6EHI_130460 [Entamoeba histolytica]|eukprot:XP_648423.1 hypothetical protein EHI_130460 [Entamoeba histolytica HM-1:IMSS]
MFGTPAKNTRNVSEDETEIEDRNATLNDVVTMIRDISSITEKCNILVKGFDLTLGNSPFISFKLIMEGHIEVIEEIECAIKAYKKNNIILLNAIKEGKRRDEREERIDKLEKKREEETKPERRKTRPL